MNTATGSSTAAEAGGPVMGQDGFTPQSVVLGVAGLVIMVAVLWLRSRGGGRAKAGGLGTWVHWKRQLGLKHAVKRARRRIPPYPVDRVDLVSFFGYAGKHELFAQHEDSIVVVGPSRSGKTRRFCARAVACAIGAVIATSTKIDLIEATITARVARGTVYVLDPLGFMDAPPAGQDQWNFGPPPYRGLTGGLRSTWWTWRHRNMDVESMRSMDLSSMVRRVRWNPLTGCDDPEVALRRAEVWASAQPMKGVKNQDWWTDRAAKVLARLMYAAAVSGYDILTVARWGQNLDNSEPGEILRKDKTVEWWANQLEQYSSSKAGETVGSIAMSIGAILSPLDSPMVVRTLTPGPDEQFDMTAFVSCRAQHASGPAAETSIDTLYLLASKKAGRTVAPLFTMLMSELIFTAAMVSQASPKQFLWPPLRIVGDELPQMAPVPDLDEDMSDSGGRGIQVICVVQAVTQLIDRYGKEKADTIMSAAALRLYLPGVREEGVQKDLNRLAGKKFVRVASGSHSSSSGERGGSSSTSWNIQEREKLPLSEVREIPDGTAWMEYRNSKIGKVNLPDWSGPPAKGAQGTAVAGTPAPARAPAGDRAVVLTKDGVGSR